MLKVLAIDDEPLALHQIVSYIGRVPFLELVGQCQSAVEASHLLQREQVDAIFCDINMPDLNGLDFVRSLTNPPLVVFTTAYSEYAIEGFKVEAVDYLLKPFTSGEFTRTAERLRARHELLLRARQASDDNAQSQRLEDIIYIRADRMDIAVGLSTIRYVQAMGEYLRIYTTDRRTPITTLMKMKVIEERLPAERFMRIHRSTIVSLASIREVGRGYLVLSDGTRLSIGLLYRPTIESWIANRNLKSKVK